MKEICRNVWRKCWRIRNRRRKAHQENADFICGKYNWDRVTEQTLHLYQHVLKARENQK